MPKPGSPTIVPMDGAQRALADGLGSLHAPDAYGLTLLDLTEAERFRAQRAAQSGVPLTLFDLVLRAVALSFGRDQRGRTLLQGYDFHRYETVDIGVSIAARSEVAPIIIFRDAAQLSLEEIHRQRVEKTRQALEQQAEKRAQLLRQTRYLPDKIRRALIRHLMGRAQLRREMVGTVQVSAVELHNLEWFLPAHMTTSFLLCLGGIRERPLVFEGRVEARLCVYASLMIDQRVIHPVQGMRVVQRWRHAMLKPEKLGVGVEDYFTQRGERFSLTRLRRAQAPSPGGRRKAVSAIMEELSLISALRKSFSLRERVPELCEGG